MDFNRNWSRMKTCLDPIYGKLILFSGVDQEKDQDLLRSMEVEDVMLSYYHLRKRGKKSLEKTFANFRIIGLYSGIQTYHNGLKRSGGAGLQEELEAYCRDYIEFCDLWANQLSFVISTDAEDLVGAEFNDAVCEELRDREVRAYPVITYGNIEHNLKVGKLKCKEVCFAGELVKGFTIDSKEIIDFCVRNKIITHALAAKDAMAASSANLFSIDTGAWLNAVKYGTTYIFKGGALRTYDKNSKSIRTLSKKEYMDAGIDWRGVELEKRKEVSQINILAWRRYKEHVAQDISQAYWLSNYEKAEAADYFRQRNGLSHTQEDMTKQLQDMARSPDNYRPHVISNQRDIIQLLSPQVTEPLKCNTCDIQRSCAHFKPNMACYYNTMVAINGLDDAKTVTGLMLSVQANRINRFANFEAQRGGSPDPQIAKEMREFRQMSKGYTDIVEAAKPQFGDLPAATVTEEGKKGGDRVMNAIFSEVVEEGDEEGEQITEEMNSYGP